MSLVLLARFTALAVAVMTTSGCVTRGYKLAAKDTPPPVPLNLAAAVVPATPETETPPAPATSNTAPAAEALLHTVIIYQGPGSWKREAYWDEYVLTLTNRGNEPIVFTHAMLHSNMADSVEPGDNPWKLERVGKDWWQTNAARQTGTYLLLGAGTVAGAGIVTAAVFTGGIFAPLTGGAAIAAGAGVAVMAAMPIVAIGTVGMNLKRKHQIQDEFSRRRLVLPLTLAPGQNAQGSLFFRITPSPRELMLKAACGAQTTDLAVNLAPLSSLHLRMPVANPAPK